MGKAVKYISCLLLLGKSIASFAQTTPVLFERYGLEYGLSQMSGYCIAQDKDGFMWMGTQDGLNRFDGYSFATFRNTEYRAIPSNDVEYLSTDNHGNLWIATHNGICVRRYANGQFAAAKNILGFASALDSVL